MGTSKPPHKRRKLTCALSAAITVDSESPTLTVTNTEPINISSKPSGLLLSTGMTINNGTAAAPACASCHRALNTTQVLLIVCARCASPTCAICSRTCTACVPSLPPTPHLTWSPTPSPSPMPSPRRSALTLNSPNTNGINISLPGVAGVGGLTPGRRRKVRDDDRDEWAGGENLDGNLSGQENEGCGPGCGRTFCRNCCFENLLSNSTTCYDCYGRR